MKTPLYTISIVAHGQLDWTRRCIEAVIAHSADYELILTDNGSPAVSGVTEYFQGLQIPGVHVGVLRNEANLGFGAPHNTALGFARGVYFVALNNDVEVCAGWLDQMRAEFLRDPRLGACGVRGACGSLDGQGHGGAGPELEYAEASCLMIPAWLARREGLFDPAYRFAYCEDADLSLRLRERGWGIAAAPLPVRHARAVTSQAVSGTADLAGHHARNHQVLRTRWATYLQRRHFRHRVGVRRMGAAGDVVMATPVIRAIRERWADSEITAITAQPAVFKRNPDIANVKHAVTVQDTFDHFYDLDLAYERQPQRHAIDAYAEVCGVTVADRRPRVYPADSDRAWARTTLPGRWAVIHPGTTAWVGRNWDPERFSVVSDALRGAGWRVAVVGNSATPAVRCELDLRGCTSFHQLAAAMEQAGVFVGIDSLPMHLALASLTPAVAVFGCIDPATRLPGWPFARGVVAEGVGCLGCHHVQPAPRTSSQCLRDRAHCMERLDVDRVMAAIREVLEAMPMFQETSKIRGFVLKYVEGKTVDLGCGRDPILAGCVAVDDDDWPEVTHRLDIAGPLPFADGEFQTVYSSHALEDLTDPAGVLREWVRILEPGGCIILQVPHPQLYTGVNLDHKWPGFTPDELEAFLAPLGCETAWKYVDDGPDRYSSVLVARKAL